MFINCCLNNYWFIFEQLILFQKGETCDTLSSLTLIKACIMSTQLKKHTYILPKILIIINNDITNVIIMVRLHPDTDQNDRVHY